MCYFSPDENLEKCKDYLIKQPRIVIVAPLFPPFLGAVSSRLESLARYWSRLADVTVITREKSREVEPYRRIVLPLANWRWSFLRIPLNISPLNRLVRDIKPVVLFTSIPGAWPLLETYMLSRRLGKPMIVDVRDLPTSTYSSKETTLLRKLFYLFMRGMALSLLRKASKIVTVTDTVKERLSGLLNMPLREMEVIKNGYDLKVKSASVSSPLRKEYDIVYSGTLIPTRDPSGIIQFLRFLSEFRPDFKALFVSDFTSQVAKDFKRKVKYHGLEKNVKFMGMQPPIKLSRILESARLGLDSHKPQVKEECGAISAKDYEYLASGLPVIGLLDPIFYVETRRLISDNSAGILDPDPLSLAQKTAGLLKSTSLLKQMSQKARNLGKAFDRKTLAEDYYRRVILSVWKKFNACRLSSGR